MKPMIFHGYSDDTFGEYGRTRDDHDTHGEDEYDDRSPPSAVRADRLRDEAMTRRKRNRARTLFARDVVILCSFVVVDRDQRIDPARTVAFRTWLVRNMRKIREERTVSRRRRRS